MPELKLSLSAAAEARKREARATFTAAIWTDDPDPAELVRLGEAAGLNVGEMERRVADAERARADVALADDLAERRRKRDELAKTAEAVAEKNGSTIARLQGEINAASFAASAASAAEMESSGAVARLVALAERGELPEAVIPQSVKDKQAADDLERRARAAYLALRAARDKAARLDQDERAAAELADAEKAYDDLAHVEHVAELQADVARASDEVDRLTGRVAAEPNNETLPPLLGRAKKHLGECKAAVKRWGKDDAGTKAT